MYADRREGQGHRGLLRGAGALRGAAGGARAGAAHRLLQPARAYAQQVGWTLIPEQTLAGGARPDGVLRDRSLFYRGYWEAKDTRDDLEAEINKKVARGYPLTNTIFEDTRRAILYQNGRRAQEADLRVPRQLADLLRTFFDYEEAEIERFEQAIEVFRERIPDLAIQLKGLIESERRESGAFETAFQTFFTLCQSAIDPRISEAAVEEMLVQHLLTERLIRVIFDNPDFARRNVIAQEIETVITALTKRSFNRNDFLRALDPYYAAVEQAAGRATLGSDPGPTASIFSTWSTSASFRATPSARPTPTASSTPRRRSWTSWPPAWMRS